MKLYMVDQENVGGSGIRGMSSLHSEDRVIIFCNHIMKSVPFATHIEIVNCKAQVEYKVIERCGPNYLDFQLVTYLGYLIAQTHYEEIIIVSKDKGYEAVVDFWRDKGLKIHRQSNIKVEESRPKQKQSIPGKADTKALKALLKEKVKLTPAEYKKVYAVFQESSEKMEFHEKLCHELGQDNGDKVYKALRQAFSQSLPERKK
ncbi:MAG: PIN domain-containing protein [Bulleidia sp.]|nr:PIN domain-containing protein [Bulleidia sp.]